MRRYPQDSCLVVQTPLLGLSKRAPPLYHGHGVWVLNHSTETNEVCRDFLYEPVSTTPDTPPAPTTTWGVALGSQPVWSACHAYHSHHSKTADNAMPRALRTAVNMNSKSALPTSPTVTQVGVPVYLLMFLSFAVML